MTKKQLTTKLFGRAYYLEGNVPAKIEIGYYYKITITCANCGEINIVYIRKGRFVKGVSPSIRCRNCDCSLKEIK